MSNIDFTGRVAIVTGAGAGLGRCHALELAKRGAKVIVNDLGGSLDGKGSGESAAGKVVEEIKALGGEASPNFDNVATVEGGENIVKAAIDAYGKLDILVNNAGILRDKTFAKMDEKSWDAVLAVHLRGAYCVSRPAFIKMKENGYGRIIVTTSAAGLFGNFGQANYAAAKAGLLGLINVLKLEGKKSNILCNALAPIAATRMTEGLIPPEFLERMTVEYVTPAVVYMCSEQCTDSGTIINAAAGYYSKSSIVTGPGFIITDGDKPASPESIMENWDKITSLENSKVFIDSNGIFGDMGLGA